MKAIGKKKVRDLQVGDIFSVNEQEFDETAQLRYVYGEKRAEDVRDIKKVSMFHGAPMNSIDWHTFNFVCGRADGVDICHFGTSFTYHSVPSMDTEVFFFGRRTEERFMTKEEKAAMAKEIWDKVFADMPYSVRSQLEKVYSVDLFGKRGWYSENGERFYLKQSLGAMRELQKMIGEKTIVKVVFENDDNIENLDYSRRYETECYGCRHTLVKLFYDDNSTETYYF